MGRKKSEPDLNWPLWTESWNDFVLSRTGAPAAFTGADLKGLKNIKKFFLKCSNPKTGMTNTEEEALYCFKYILSNWDRLDKFRKQFNLMFIYSHISDYLSDLRRGSRLQSSRVATEQARESGYQQFKRNL